MAGLAKIIDTGFFDTPESPCAQAKVFVPTGSDNPNILVSLNQFTVPGSIKSVFAGPITNYPNVGGPEQGILITVIFSDNVQPATSVVIMTVQQDGVQNYEDSKQYNPA